MTNHIEELMKAAGVEKQYYSFNSTDGNTYNWELNENGNKKYKKIFIGEPELKERTFTPAKQLELIKLIGQKSGFYIHQNEGMDWLLSDSIYADLSFNTQGYSYSSFENALCKLTINLLKKKALNKSEVKRILEDDN